MTWNHIGATLEQRHCYTTPVLNNDIGRHSATMTYVSGMKNTFGMSVYSKEYTFLIFFLRPNTKPGFNEIQLQTTPALTT
jgi:hypothetical protein